MTNEKFNQTVTVNESSPCDFSWKVNLKEERNLDSISSRSYSVRKPSSKKTKKRAKLTWWRLTLRYEKEFVCSKVTVRNKARVT